MQLTALVLDIEDYMLPCMNKKYLGVDCPGCGIQRAIALLWEGNFVDAFYMYPAIYPMLLLLSFLLIDLFLKVKYASKIIASLAITTVVFIVINYILKFL